MTIDLDISWKSFVKKCDQCRACALFENRQQVVVSRGAIHAPLVFIGEGPGAEEDAQGLPFVGRSGKLLNYLLQANGFSEEQYHVCNIVKCRPPENRKPSRDEATACMPLLKEQLQFVKAKVAVLLGATAYNYFCDSDQAITKARGQFTEKDGMLVLPTFHPAYILRNNNMRIHLWNDIVLVRQKMEEMNLLKPLQFVPEMPR